MSEWLPWALLVLVVMVLAAMPWRRPHPNHEFMLHMLRLLEDDNTSVASESLPNGRRPNTDAKHRPGSPDTTGMTGVCLAAGKQPSEIRPFARGGYQCRPSPHKR